MVVMKINLLAGAKGSTGFARYTNELYNCLREMDVDVHLVEPQPAEPPGFVTSMFKRMGWDMRTFLTNYPLMVGAPKDGLLHITNQNLGTAMLFKRPEPAVITVHDIIPYILRRDRYLSGYTSAAHRIVDMLAMIGVKKARTIIADSRYTKDTLLQHLGINPERIHVVYLGVDRCRFYPIDVPDDFYEKYGLDKDISYVLFVGSEDPRKNLDFLLRAFALVRKERKDVQLLKVGAARFIQSRHKSIELIEQLGIEDAVRFLDEVGDGDLPLFYNAAKVFAFPSFYEGFGLPALEAMSCGTPVVASDRSSVPEVVADAGIIVDASDERAWAEAILGVLDSPSLQQQLGSLGLQRAQHLSWEKTAEETVKVYTIVDDPREVK